MLFLGHQIIKKTGKCFGSRVLVEWGHIYETTIAVVNLPVFGWNGDI